MTYKEAYDYGISSLNAAKISEADIDAWYLLEHVAKINRTWFILNKQEDIPDNIKKDYEAVIAKRSMHIPLQHITGCQEFMGYKFKVNENVLIPRQDTEILVEEVYKHVKDNHRILDVCTGSGCIIISLKLLNPTIKAFASDLSDKALKVATENAKLNNADVKFIQSDLFEKIEGSFDIIVSNPPYIPSSTISTLMPEVREHEPLMALDGSESGLVFYEKIVRTAKEYLNTNGYLCFEIGHDQGKSVSELMEQEGFENVRVIKDLAGLDRVVVGKYM